MWSTLLESNEPKYRLLRTIIQGVIGVIIANMDMLVGLAPIPAMIKPMIVALVMACLSPIMAYIGEQSTGHGDTEDVPELDEYVEGWEYVEKEEENE